jgi:hypothetical protein
MPVTVRVYVTAVAPGGVIGLVDLLPEFPLSVARLGSSACRHCARGRESHPFDEPWRQHDYDDVNVIRALRLIGRSHA